MGLHASLAKINFMYIYTRYWASKLNYNKEKYIKNIPWQIGVEQVARRAQCEFISQLTSALWLVKFSARANRNAERDHRGVE